MQASDSSCTPTSTAASFDTAVKRSETAAREWFPAPRPQDGILHSVLRLPYPLLEGTMLFVAPPVPVSYLYQTRFVLVQAQTVTSPSARSARRMARHALIPAGQVAEPRAAATATAASLRDPEYRRMPPPRPRFPPLPRCSPPSRCVSPIPGLACNGQQKQGRSHPAPPGLPAA